MADLPTLFHGFPVTHHLLHTPAQASDTYGGVVVAIDKNKFDLVDYIIYLPGRILTAVLRHLTSQEECLYILFWSSSWHLHCRTVAAGYALFDATTYGHF